MNNNKSNSLTKEIVIRSIKIIDIGFLTILYFTIGYIFSYYVNKLYEPFNPKQPHSNQYIIFLEVCLQLFLIGIMVYIIRNLVALIPWPLDGVFGYDHKRVKELNSGGAALAFGIFYAQDNIKDKMTYISTLYSS
jgi:hypothetical protein